MLRLALTGAAVLAILFVLCWAAAVAGVPGSHAFISLFTTFGIATAGALGVGLVWSIVIGLLTGALAALAYNGFAFADGAERNSSIEVQP